MLISRTSQYAIQSMIYIATQPLGTPILSREVAEKLQVPAAYLAKIMQMLCKGGLVTSFRGRLGGRRRRVHPRTVAALGYLTDGPIVDSLIEVEKLTMVLLYDEPIHSGPYALRLAGYCGNRIPWGVRFGGPANCRFLKDLALQPVPGGQGYRIDLADEELLALGLQLDREFDRHARFNRPVRERPSLPRFWAGFRPEDAAGITAEGPELAAYAARTGETPARLLERLRREHQGLTLHPLAWVSHLWQQAAAIFADLRQFPKRQVFRLWRRDDLAGFQGAAEFDFMGRAGVERRRMRRPDRALAAA